jgi:lipoate-protein ligase B
MSFSIENWGVVPYGEATDRQVAMVDRVLSGEVNDTLIFVEHPPIYTLGANFHRENLLLSDADYAERGVEIFATERGGDITYHGPGQLVIYPIFDLRRHGQDLHRWMRDLEETMMKSATAFGLEPRRFPPNTGVWLGNEKLAAIGVKIRRWVSFHGIALNCDNDLTPFEWIVPCGIQSHGVTSLTEATGRVVGVDEARPVVIDAFRAVFT